MVYLFNSESVLLVNPWQSAKLHVVFAIKSPDLMPHWRRKQLMFGGAKVIVDLTIKVVLGCFIN